MASDAESDNIAGAFIRLNPLLAGKRQKHAGQSLVTPMRMLRAWQSARLQRTHQDLLASPRYGPACRFFLSDIYAPRDFSQRDLDMKHVYDSMHRFLPPRVNETLRLLFELNQLTAELDELLFFVLVEQFPITNEIVAAEYAEAYRLCDNYPDRVRQIDLIVDIGRDVDWLVHRPLISGALRLARTPAKLAGWSELQSFFERGFEAFKQMGGAEPFLEMIEQREMKILDLIYAGEPDPFAI